VKLTAYILIFALFFASAGATLLFFPELQHIRTVMGRKIEEHEKDAEFIFTKEAFSRLEWTKKDKEFLFKGKMYDVASIKREGNLVRVFCLFDNEETDLRQKLKAFFPVLPDKNLPLQTTVKVLSQKYFSARFFCLSGLSDFRILMYKPYLFSLRIFENELTGPPPKA